MKMKLLHGRNGWRVRIVWHNGRIFATSEAYDTRWKAVRAAKSAARLLSAALPSQLFVD